METAKVMDTVLKEQNTSVFKPYSFRRGKGNSAFD